MKKTIILLLTLSLILGVFSSCGHKTVDPIDNQTSSSPSEDTSAESTKNVIDDSTESNEVNQSENTETDDRLTEITEETVKPSESIQKKGIFYFSSFDELKEFFTNKNSIVQQQKHLGDESFLRFVNFLTDNNDKILQPLYIGEPLKKSDNKVMDGYIQRRAMYQYPSIGYSTSEAVIQFTYLDVVTGRDFSDFNNTLDILREIALDTDMDIVNKMESIDIEVDGKIISAAVTKEQFGFQIDFYYDGMYFSMNNFRGSSGSKTKAFEFLKGFSMG